MSPSPAPALAFAPGRPSRPVTSERQVSVMPRDLIPLVGKITRENLAHAVTLLNGLAPRLKEKAHDPSGARAVIFALLLSQEPQARQLQFKLLSQAGDPLCGPETLEISSLVDGSSPQARIPLLDLALPALRRLSPRQYGEFQGLVQGMVEADQELELFEYTLLHVLARHLQPHFSKLSPPTVKYRSLQPLDGECSCLLSALAHAGHPDEESARRAFGQGAKELHGLESRLSFRSPQSSSLKMVSDALAKLDLVSSDLKRQLIAAGAASVSHDYRVTVEEGELLRAVADSLDCPMPPLLAGQVLR